jgi:transposase
MYYVGIDVSKHFHVAYVIDENENIISSITLENNDDNKNSVIDNLRSIPGISDKTIITVLSEAGDLNRFKNVKKFVAYVGLFPEISQSGKYNKTKSISKKGNKKIKTAFYQAAVASIRHNNEMKKLYLDTISKKELKKKLLLLLLENLCIYFILFINTIHLITLRGYLNL